MPCFLMQWGFPGDAADVGKKQFEGDGDSRGYLGILENDEMLKQLRQVRVTKVVATT